MKFLKAVSNDISRAYIIWFIAILIVVPLAILLLVLLYQYNLDALPNWLLLALFAGWITIFFGGISIFISSTLRRRKKWLDSVFVPLGMIGRRYMFNWNEYNGIVNGRKAQVRFYKGPTLEFSFETSVQTRFVVSGADQTDLTLSHIVKFSLVQHMLTGVVISALDEQWMTDLISDPQTAEVLQRLLHAGESWALIQQIILSPGSLRLLLYRNKNIFQFNFTAQEAQHWANDLSTVLNAAEALPAPRVTAEPTKLEIAVRTGSSVRRAFIILTAFFLFIGACVGLTIWLLVSFVG